ncbi:DNA anti-recombination protein RmuC [Rheinheimera pacifica]|uniref:hypothetical protein n=1 Tax=Rheinheimera pacifica TaxID=173990 RepID=UPI00285467B8|nr:hypothetical protein [Rheinheimera pacifica]MDR6982895.1 DNA anti-recombination protein RmuC [Rheinheimera pacifica]
MATQNWGNNDPSRQYQAPAQQLSQPLSYAKLYLTIVAAILTAFFIMGVISMLFSAVVARSLFAEFNVKTTALSQPKKQHSDGLQQDLQQLANKSLQQIAEPLHQRAEQLNKQSQQQLAASRTDAQTCTFWRQQYEKERSDRNKMHLNSACKRAHGSLWNGVK